MFTFPWLSHKALLVCIVGVFNQDPHPTVECFLSLLIRRYFFFFAIYLWKKLCHLSCRVSYILIFDDFVDYIPIMSMCHVPAPSILFWVVVKSRGLIGLLVICWQECFIGSVVYFLLTSHNVFASFFCNIKINQCFQVSA